MGTEKRERQKQARQSKIQELRKTEQRENVRRRGLMIGAAVVAFLAFAIGFSILTKDDDDQQASTTDTTPVDDGSAEDPTDSTPEDTAPEPAGDPLPCPPTDGSAEQVQAFPAAPDMCIDPAKTYTATMVTDAGTIVIELAPDAAPVTVNSFVYLARYKYFDGLTFHRVIPDFVLQGGDPEGTGGGGPGYQIDDELPDPEDYQAGSLAMANAGPDTNGSQFFIVTSENGAKTLVDAVGGEAAYTLFGQVIEGMDVVAAIEADGDPTGTPATTHIIESVTITES